jgi:hypothetical protein
MVAPLTSSPAEMTSSTARITVSGTAEGNQRASRRSLALIFSALLGAVGCATGVHLGEPGDASASGASSNAGNPGGGTGARGASGGAESGGTGGGATGGADTMGGAGSGASAGEAGSGGNGEAGSGGNGGAGSGNGGSSAGGSSNGGSGNGGNGDTGGTGGTGGSGTGGTGGSGTGGTGGSGTGGSGGTGGVGGSGGTGGAGAVDPIGNANRNPGFVDLSPPMGAVLPATGSPVTPAPPAGWTWYQIDGAVCRDGSPTGFYVKTGSADKLIIYLEGGGACMNGNYCSFNASNANQILAGDGQTVFGTAGGLVAARQQPGVYTNGTGLQGIFDTTNSANPVKDWNQIYVPYCTGDVHFGTRKDAPVPGLTPPQQFVGYANMRLFMGRIVPTFKSKVSRVLLTGASAGGFGAALNFSMVQDSFGDVRVDLIDDSGPPFDDQYMPPCVQKRWRDQWGFSGSLPPDCTECKSTDGGRLSKLSDFLLRKHKKSNVGFISTMQDEVIRLFFSAGLSNCQNYDTANPVTIVLLQTDPTVYFAAQPYTDGLTALRSNYVNTGRFSTYYMGGLAPNVQWHQHVFRSRFYDKGGANPSPSVESIAGFFTNFLSDKMEQVGP